MSLYKYIGRTLCMIYIDGKGNISRRRVIVKRIGGQFLYAYCLDRRAPRTFRMENILFAMPVTNRHVG